jgi:2-oxoglutarate dehydrogenase complex dehydrogenase (E1) component-like enzyme
MIFFAPTLFCRKDTVYYDLMAEHEKSGNGHIAILRLEQFYPFPQTLLRQWLTAYTKAEEIVWARLGVGRAAEYGRMEFHATAVGSIVEC